MTARRRASAELPTPAPSAWHDDAPIDADEETRRPIRGARRGRRPGPIGLADLQHGRALAAFAVLNFGEQYLGIFERLDEACAQLERRDASLSRVRAIAARDGAPRL